MDIPQPVAEMLKTLRAGGFSAFLVGGCVRDALLGLVPHDYDIATDAIPEEIIALFGEQHCTYYGKAFGTVCVRLDGGSAEVTTFRTESDYRDCRHPGVVTFAKDIREDLSRRDFTCNAIAYDPETGIFDPFGGQKDLADGILRCVGVPLARFREDALRILRGMRFYARFGLRPEPLTDAAMRAAAFRLKAISAERVSTELCGMLTGEHITEVLLAYPHILGEWIPEILPAVSFTQHSKHHDLTVWEHSARAVGIADPDLTVRLTMLLHDLGKPALYKTDRRGGHFRGHAQRGAQMADSILLRLRCDNAMRRRVCRLIELHRIIPKDMPTVRRLYGRLGEAEMRQFLAVLRADNHSKLKNGAEAPERIEKAAALFRECREKDLCCTIGQLAVNGKDAAALGLRGEAIGHMLAAVLEAVITEQLPNEREALLAAMQKRSFS